ncbi:MAG: hypothetical protein ACYTEQ_01370 [Planctomycetota bacterium]|jgi:hypothetical protein
MALSTLTWNGIGLTDHYTLIGQGLPKAEMVEVTFPFSTGREFYLSGSQQRADTSVSFRFGEDGLRNSIIHSSTPAGVRSILDQVTAKAAIDPVGDLSFTLSGSFAAFTNMEIVDFPGNPQVLPTQSPIAGWQYVARVEMAFRQWNS